MPYYPTLHMTKLYTNTLLKYLISKPALFFLVLIYSYKANAQCPTNIDFEMGDFTGWQCWVGTHYVLGAGLDSIDLGTTPVPPTPNRHEIISSATLPKRDVYGNFPVLCPNGSGYSVKLGNTSGGHEAEGVSYVFTIPPGQNKFNIVYNYAVVFQGPQHLDEEQPRLKIQVRNLTDNVMLSCSSFDFFYKVGTPLPGFYPAVFNPTGTPIWCKDWAANSVDLDNLAGKTIEIFFKTADCIYTAHFGYAYLDVSTQCSSAFTGGTFCHDDTAVSVSAPSGYETYTWYDGTHTNMIGNTQSITLVPPPLSGDSVLVDVTPFNGYGCPSTFKAYLFDTLTVRCDAGPDRKTCDNNPVQIGMTPEPGRVYKWTPATGLSDPNIANPIATPSVTTTYTLTVKNSGGGCTTTDDVKVTVDVLSDSIEQIGPSSHCTKTGETVSLKVLPHDSVQWYWNGNPIPGATLTKYNVTQSGAYYADVFSFAGCKRTTAVKQIDIWESPVAGFSTTPDVQCFNNNQFVFTNNSTLNTGTLQYAWDLGDGNTATTRDVTYSYAKEGAYNIKMLVTAPGGCKDSAFYDVLVNPSPTAAFVIDKDVQCFKNNWFVFDTRSTTSSGVLTYAWDFGDGNFNNSNTIAHHYMVPGTYNVKLIATANGGCTDDSTLQVVVNPSPVADFSANNYNQCFPGHNYILTNNSSIFSGAMQYLWSFGDGMYDTVPSPSHIYKKYGNYTIKLLADFGGACQDSISKNIEIYPVPQPDFSVQSVCQDLRVPVINRTTNISNSTVNYFWDFGNGHLDNAYTPMYTYTQPGNYSITLSVSTAQCPTSFNAVTKSVVVEQAIPGITYPDKDAAYNFDQQLQARNIGTKVIWDPPANLNNRFSYSPIFRGITPQLYTIQLTTSAGCVTVDTQLVKTHKKIEIYVPTGFTPGNDNINERLRPILIGFVKVNYFRIYDRWGKLLFSMNSDQPGWDGKINGNPAEMQTVVWMIEAVDVDGKVHNKQGTTVVIR